MKKRYFITFLILFLLLFLLVIINLLLGTQDISISQLISVLEGNNDNEMLNAIIFKIRLPRILAAVILGGALSISGFLLQTFFGNPIAGPYVLGISSGAKLVVAIVMIALLNRNITISSWGMVSAAFIGSLIAMSFVLIISTRVKNMSILVVCGILIGYICSAITDFLVTFANDSNIVNLHNWSLGSFSGINSSQVVMMAWIVFISVAIVFLLSKPIGALSLGENYARNMGVNITALRVAIILLSSILSATVTAFAGPVSFIGIAIPHLVKITLKTSKPIILIPACALAGGALTLMCDGIARCLFAPTEVSISSVTAVIFAPVVIWMMLGRKVKDN